MYFEYETLTDEGGGRNPTDPYNGRLEKVAGIIPVVTDQNLRQQNENRFSMI